MHVNPAVIRYNSGTYNAHSAPQSVGKSAEKVPVSTDKMADKAEKSAKEDEFSFWDLVDIVNPLQHIPVVNAVYREITGDQINNFGRIAGGAIFGGFLGAAIGGVNAIAKNETGDDLGEMAMVKAGFRASSKPQEKPLEMVPVVPKHADAKIAASGAHERATLETIIWDAPSLLDVATKDTIKWDNAVTSSAVEIAATTEPKKAAMQAAKIPDHVVRDVPENAYQMAAAMPDAKSLNDMEPGNPNSPMPQASETVNVPQNMMQALAKYQSMQRMGGENAVAAQDLNVASAQRKFTKLNPAIRRF